MTASGACNHPTCDAAAALKALKMMSVTRWLVRTLPPTTAASSLGLSKQPGGIVMVTGARQPCKPALSMRRVEPFMPGTAVLLAVRMHGETAQLLTAV